MRALLSVSDKTGLVPFASAPGRAAGGNWCRPAARPGRWRPRACRSSAISDVTGFPEMMDGRVKTLHPEGPRRHPRAPASADDLASLAAHGIRPIDLVVVNLYPFAKAAARPDLPFDDLIEEIDIGGPSLVRAAAKNFRDVLVVVEPADYDARARGARRRPAGRPLSFAVRSGAARLAHTAAYDR